MLKEVAVHAAQGVREITLLCQNDNAFRCEMEGGETDDLISGDNHDPLNRELGGDDILIGMGGDDELEGEFGDDVAVFSEEVDNYDIAANEDGSLTVVHARGAMSDGSDLLTSIEQLEFADGTVAANDFLLA